MNRRHFLGGMAAMGAAMAFPVPLLATEARPPKGMVTLCFDDGLMSIHEYAQPVLKKWGLTATAGIVVTRMLSGNNDYMNVEQIRNLAGGGWEIASHSMTETTPLQMPKTREQEGISGWRPYENEPDHFQALYDYERIAALFQDGKQLKEAENMEQMRSLPGSYWLDRTIAELHIHPYRGGDPANLNIRAASYQWEIEDSKKALMEFGFNVDTFVATQSYWSDEIKEISTRTYSRACTLGNSDNRVATFDRYAIKRFPVGKHDTANTLKRVVKDHCLDRGGWAVFSLHGVEDKIGPNPFSVENLDAFAAWLVEEKIPVVTVREGANRMLTARESDGSVDKGGDKS